MSQTIRIHAIIHGRVQGVSFRYYTKQTADVWGITGWVRNRPDQTVEVLAEGTEDSMDKFTQFLRQGPPSARVDKIELSENEASNEFDSFKITYFTGEH